MPGALEHSLRPTPGPGCCDRGTVVLQDSSAFSLIGALPFTQIGQSVTDIFSSKSLPPDGRRVVGICLGLAILTFLVFWPVRDFAFTNYDDDAYVYANPMVTSGLNAVSIRWALTTTWFSYWHPLTWMSHMLDCTLFGLRPGAHHLMSVFYHTLATVCLFLTLRRMTGATMRGAVVAALFAIHPMHVESVAWVAERKDALSTLFWILTLWAYTVYAARPSTARYVVTLALYAVGLTAKPMVVTLPFVLLLLDYWPLKRLSWGQMNSAPREIAQAPIVRGVVDLVVEKIPFFLLSAASMFITFTAVQRAGNTLSADVLPWSFRFTNVPVSYARYLGKLILPDDMTILYPIPPRWESWQVGGAAVVLVVISLLVAAWARSKPYLVTGWLWFLGTLVPTLSLVAVGYQSLADRYTYLSYIGLFIIVVWGVADLARARGGHALLLRSGTVAVLLLCAVGARAQLKHWRDSISLWTHCVAVTRDNVVAQYNLGHALQHLDKGEEALAHYRAVLRLQPDHVNANLNIAGVYIGSGRSAEATNYLARVLRLQPQYLKGQVSMGQALWQLRELTQATNYFARALAAAPADADTRFYYAATLFDLKDYDGALREAEETLRIDPSHFKARTWLAKALVAKNRFDEAQAHLQEALRIDPSFSPAHDALGFAQLRQGKIIPALAQFEAALVLDPASAEAHFHFATALTLQGRVREAVQHYREALQSRKDWPEALNDLAWLLATHPDASVRNGQEALHLAGRACALDENPRFLATLAAAHAESGDFDEAIRQARKARELAQARGDAELVERAGRLAAHFQHKQPWRSSPTGSWTNPK